MAKNEEELKKEVARLREEYETAIPRLTNLAAAVIDVFKNNETSPPEVVAVCLNLLLQAVGHIFGEVQADVLAEAISQVLAQLSDDPLAKELFKQTRGQDRPN
jgi:hypothetical protein